MGGDGTEEHIFVWRVFLLCAVADKLAREQEALRELERENRFFQNNGTLIERVPGCENSRNPRTGGVGEVLVFHLCPSPSIFKK